jgi:hypothetical protein
MSKNRFKQYLKLSTCVVVLFKRNSYFFIEIFLLNVINCFKIFIIKGNGQKTRWRGNERKNINAICGLRCGSSIVILIPLLQFYFLKTLFFFFCCCCCLLSDDKRRKGYGMSKKKTRATIMCTFYLSWLYSDLLSHNKMLLMQYSCVIFWCQFSDSFSQWKFPFSYFELEI